MTEKREIKSFWWTPDHPETRWFGVLTLDAGCGPTLEGFVEQSEPFEGVPPLGRVIHGKDEHGKPITVLFVGSAGQTSGGAVLKLTLHSCYALMGIALPEARG